MNSQFNIIDTEERELVSVEDLQMVYRVGKVESPALRGVDFSVKRGEFVAVMGPSGCGKSTLLHLIGGLLKPTAGLITVNGFDMSRASDSDRTRVRRDKIGFVFQRFNLLPTLSAADNIELAVQIRRNQASTDRRRVSQLLELLGLRNKTHHKPSELSGGEQQRVAIARAVITRPSILLADEPTGSLDSRNSKKVLQILKDLNQKYNQTIIMITHDLEAASAASRVVEMRDGRILGPLGGLYSIEQQR